jgi:hypothetical protein
MDFSFWELFVGAAFLLHAALVPSLMGTSLNSRLKAAQQNENALMNAATAKSRYIGHFKACKILF